MCTIDNAGDCCAGADKCKGGEQRVFVRQTGNQTLGNSTQRRTTGSNQSNQKTSNHQKNTYFHALFHAVVNAPSEDEQKTNKRHNDTANLPVKPKEQIDRNSAAGEVANLVRNAAKRTNETRDSAQRLAIKFVDAVENRHSQNNLGSICRTHVNTAHE